MITSSVMVSSIDRPKASEVLSDSAYKNNDRNHANIIWLGKALQLYTQCLACYSMNLIIELPVVYSTLVS